MDQVEVVIYPVEINRGPYWVVRFYNSQNATLQYSIEAEVFDAALHSVVIAARRFTAGKILKPGVVF